MTGGDDIYGGGARKMWRRIPCIAVNKEDVEVRSYKKKPYYDLGPGGPGVLRQTLLSFTRTPTTPTRTSEDRDWAGVSNISALSSTKLGQQRRGLV